MVLTVTVLGVWMHEQNVLAILPASTESDDSKLFQHFSIEQRAGLLRVTHAAFVSAFATTFGVAAGVIAGTARRAARAAVTVTGSMGYFFEQKLWAGARVARG